MALTDIEQQYIQTSDSTSTKATSSSLKDIQADEEWIKSVMTSLPLSIFPEIQTAHQSQPSKLLLPELLEFDYDKIFCDHRGMRSQTADVSGCEKVNCLTGQYTSMTASWEIEQPVDYKILADLSSPMDTIPENNDNPGNGMDTHLSEQDLNNVRTQLPNFDTFHVLPQNWSHGQQSLYIQPGSYFQYEDQQSSPTSSSDNKSALSSSPLHSPPSDFFFAKCMAKKEHEGSRRRRNKRRKGKLWEFLRDLLLDEATNPAVVRWEDEKNGIFKIVHSDRVAYLWGARKSNPTMTYDKLSRALRYYYDQNILEKIDGQRLIYKFGDLSEA